jgi:two-component system, chemotaxis family, protein-glutamate methylesterase/glutaminase
MDEQILHFDEKREQLRDGAAALCGIKEVGGITIAQKLETAAQPDMPESAIESGCIDFVLSPEDIAKEIVRIAYRV